MATNHTTNYQLNLWTPQDSFLREEFNENTEKIDAALGSLAQTVAGKGNCTILTGTYVGTGTCGAENRMSLDFADTMGKCPAVIFVVDGGSAYLMATKGVATFWVPSETYEGLVHFIWKDTGLEWYSETRLLCHMNVKDRLYHWFALFD